MAKIACDVVLLPGQDVTQTAINLSSNLAVLGTLFTLKIGQFSPHISVYMLQLDEDDLSEVERRLTSLATATSPLCLDAVKYNQVERYFDVEYTKNDDLTNLQNQVIESLNPIRAGLRANDQARLADTSGLALTNLQRYGWRSVGDLYRPHLTITRFCDDQTYPTSGLPNIVEFNSKFSYLALFEMGENGTAARKIFDIALCPSSSSSRV